MGNSPVGRRRPIRRGRRQPQLRRNALPARWSLRSGGGKRCLYHGIATGELAMERIKLRTALAPFPGTPSQIDVAQDDGSGDRSGGNLAQILLPFVFEI